MRPHEALAESARCLSCNDAPCNHGCPAGIDVAGFIRSLRVKNFTAAARKVRANNWLATTCGYVCPGHKFCEMACSASQLARPIQINALHRFAVNAALQRGSINAEMAPPKDKKIAIIGAGPAGITCAAELGKLGYRTTIFEKRSIPGGLMQYGIPPHKLPKEQMRAEIEAILKTTSELMTDQAIGSLEEMNALFSRGYAAVFLGIGLEKPGRLGIAGEDLDGVFNWREFLSEISVAGSTSKTLPNNMRRVVVIGGGNTAIDAATSAALRGAETHLVSLEGVNEMPAFAAEIAGAKREGVIIHPRSRPLKLNEAEGRVGGVECIHTSWKAPGDFTPQNAVNLPGTQFTLEADIVVVAIGQSLECGDGSFLSSLRLKAGRIAVNPETNQTSRPGVFAGGDAIRPNGTVVESMRDGVIAARGIDRWLSGDQASV